MIQLNRVTKYYPGQTTPALSKISLTINDGETLVLLGSSGSGKSTLLKMLNRLQEPSQGSITLHGQSLHTLNPVSLRRTMGYVFQGIGLFPHMTVGENVGVQLALMGKDKTVQQERSEAMLALVHLPPEEYAHRYPHELSGGQQQRVGVARALVTNPDILLMDEPFGALDPITRHSLQKELAELAKQLQKTLVFVTHDIQEATRLGHRIAVLHQGHLQQVCLGNSRKSGQEVLLNLY